MNVQFAMFLWAQTETLMLMNGVAMLLLVGLWGGMESWDNVQPWYMVIMQG